MTMMPAQLVAADETKAILLTLEEFRRHDLTLHEARSDLALLVDGHANEDLARELLAYLEVMLRRVQSNEIVGEAAAQDIRRVVEAVVSGKADAARLTEPA